MKKYIFLLLIVCNFPAFGQDYPTSTVPENLKKDANAVIRYEECNFIQSDINNATEKVTKVITILNEKGKEFANLQFSQDKFRKLKSFSGEVILESGKSFKKIGKGDLSTTAISNHLASDDSWTYYNCSSPSYPFTVRYSYEIKWENGIVSYPVFAPMSPHVALEKSVHRIQFPASSSIRYKANEVSPNPEKRIEGKDSVYVWTCENLSAINPEPMAPSFYSLTPLVYIAPNDFCFDGVYGNLSTWKSTGIFLSKLLDKRDMLPPSTIEKVKGLMTENTRETVKRIYEYLQETTRYVSIQLGIGGFQPIPAELVAKTGFGDCKALTNYMKAMLSTAGIESDYAIVNTDKKHMFSDFSSMNQANHVILFVPLGNDSIWLECTSKDFPFDYAHHEIVGHDVLLVLGDQSRLSRVRNIPENINTEENTIQIKLAPDASISSFVNSRYKNHKMEGMLNFVLNLSEKEKMNALAQGLSVQKPQINHIQTNYTKSLPPEIEVNYQMDAVMYASKTGSRLFIPVNPFRSGFEKIFSSSSRKYDIQISTPIFETDSIAITLPPGYIVETLPKSQLLNTNFGTFSASIEAVDGKLDLIYKISISTGKYPVSSYNEIKEFFNAIDKSMKEKVVLKNAENK